VQVRCQARAHPHQLQQVIHAIPVQRHRARRDARDHQREEPTSPPEDGENLERQSRLPSADLARLGDAANREVVMAWSQVGKAHRLVLRGLAPIGIGSLQPVLVAKPLADIEV
jgi:hypothetical protein